MLRRLSAIALATVSTLSLTACSNAADAKLAEDALTFYKSTEATCNEYSAALGGDKLPSSLFATASTEDVFSENGEKFVQVVDGDGNLLLVNLTAKRIQAGVRPDEVMPKVYLSSCPAALYLGIAYELEKQG